MEEFEHYLSEFNKAEYFATIKAGGECLNSDLIQALIELYDVDLIPILVHGGGKQIDIKLKEKGITPKKIDGIRVTDEETLDVVVSTLKAVNEKLVSEINRMRQNQCARGLNDFFYVDGTDTYGYVGNVIGINKSTVDECLDEKLIPVVSSLGIDSQGRYFNPNADSAYKFLVSELKPKKVIFLTSVGGVYEREKLICEMSSEELQRFIDSRYVNEGMRVKLKEVKKLVDLGYDVQITNPENLIEELFSKKGQGTYIHR